MKEFYIGMNGDELAYKTDPDSALILKLLFWVQAGWSHFNVDSWDHNAVQQLPQILNLQMFSSQFEFSPQTLCCYGKQLCTIQRDAAYFSYQNR